MKEIQQLKHMLETVSVDRNICHEFRVNVIRALQNKIAELDMHLYVYGSYPDDEIEEEPNETIRKMFS